MIALKFDFNEKCRTKMLQSLHQNLFLFIKLLIEILSDHACLGTCYFGISLGDFHAYSTASLGSKGSKCRTGAIFKLPIHY